MDANGTRQALYDDINNYMQYLPQQRTCEDKEARAGAALGYMLMAKFMMWNQQWDDAIVPLLKLEELYGDLQQYPLHEIMWRYKNVPEGIFELQLNYAPDGVQYYGNVACIMMPPHQGNAVFNGVKLTGYGDTMVAWASLRANNYLGIFRPAYAKTPEAVQKTQQSGYDTGGIYNPLPLTYDDHAVDEDKNGINDNVFFTSDQYRYYVMLDKEAVKTGKLADGTPVDKRIQYKLGLGNVDSESTIGKDFTFAYVRDWGVPWPGPQFWCPNITSSYDGNNYRLFRYADAILMLAECYCEKGNDAEAIKYLNMVKERAGIHAYENFSSFEELTVEIRTERGRELAGEFMRKYDLVRWGIWYEQTYNYTNYAKLKDKMKPCHRYYPIPDTQCGLSGGALTNDEYTANGM
ncbi:MAG: RagB/SusD family nutrient uptake outer membrane protein [Alistipes sp.]|nr:RagB/SusD family nutrient uptake outer membrane protein [Alistipes sp.]